MLAWNSTAQTSQQWIQGRVGVHSCALTLLRVLFFFNAHDSKASAATCFDEQGSHTARVYTSTQQKHNISWAGDKDTPRRRRRDNGKRFHLELFRFGLVARLDNTSTCATGTTTGHLLKAFLRVLCSAVFWLLIRGRSQKTTRAVC